MGLGPILKASLTTGSLKALSPNAVTFEVLGLGLQHQNQGGCNSAQNSHCLRDQVMLLSVEVMEAQSPVSTSVTGSFPGMARGKGRMQNGN